MAGGALDFLINIKQQLSGGNVVGELDKLENKIRGEAAALSALEAQMAKMQRAKSMDIDAYKALQGKIDAQKSSLGGLLGQYQTAAGAQQALTAATRQHEYATEQSASRMQMLGGAITAVIAISLAAVAVITGLAAKLVMFALGAADAHRSFLLVMQGATGSAAAAKGASDAIDRVAAKSALARDAVQDMGKHLAVAGLSGKLFEETLRAMATVASVAGPEAAGHIQAVVEKSKALGHFEIKAKGLKGLGISMGELAAAMGMDQAKMEAGMKAGTITTEQGVSAMNKALQKRFGAAAEGQSLGFMVQMMKLKENLGKLFEDVKIEAFLKAMQNVLSIFDSTTGTGKALKEILTIMFSGLADSAAGAGPFVKEVLIGMLIAVLQLYVWFKQLKAEIGSLGGGGFDGIMVGKVLMYGLAIAIGAVVLVLAIVAISIALMVAFVLVGVAIIIAIFAAMVAVIYGIISAVEVVGGAIGDAFSGAGDAVSGVVSSISSAFDSLGSIDLAATAGHVIDGFIGGITGAAGQLFSAVAGLAGGVMGAFTGALGIKSPSTKFAAFGGHTVDGYAEGVEDNSDKANAAVAKMVDIPEGGAGAGGKGKSKGGRTVHIDQIGPFYGVGNEASWRAMVEEAVIAIVERVDLAGPEPEGAT